MFLKIHFLIHLSQKVYNIYFVRVACSRTLSFHSVLGKDSREQRRIYNPVKHL